MKTARLHPLFAAILSSGCALAAAFGLSATLQHRAAAASHALPAAGRNFLDATQATPALVHHGATLYLNSCAHCHGDDARGDEGPDLHGLEVSDRRIATVISRGIKGEMPSFAKKHGREDIVALIAYLRTLQQ